MQLNLKDHVVVVTGGASGIGRAVVQAFAQEEAQAVIWDVSAERDDTAEQLSNQTQQPLRAYFADIADSSSVEAAVEQTERECGPILHLVHCAAIGSGKFGFPFTNLSTEDWPRVLEVNVLGMAHVAHAVSPRMIDRSESGGPAGSMVFLASVAGQIGSPTDPPYSASKAANINFAQCMARDLAPYGIRVNTVCPGMVQTPLNRSVWQAWHDQQPAEARRSYEDWAAEKIRNVVPMGKWQRPEDIADMVVFLSSERAAHVTGQTINVDGGFVMHW